MILDSTRRHDLENQRYPSRKAHQIKLPVDWDRLSWTAMIPGTEIEKQDCDGNRVFVGSEFAYFGSLAPVIPTDHLWGAKLIRQLTKRAVGVTYILGGTCADPWNSTDLDEFNVFISANKPDCIPDPIDFDLWKGSSDENTSKSG